MEKSGQSWSVSVADTATEEVSNVLYQHEYKKALMLSKSGLKILLVRNLDKAANFLLWNCRGGR